MDVTTALLIILAAISGVTSSFLIVMRRKLMQLEKENKRLQYLVSQLKKGACMGSPFDNSRVANPRVPENLDLRILELYYRGLSLRQIAKEVGVSHTTVHRRLKKLLASIPQGDRNKEPVAATT